jgi:hypothetical protein
MQESDRFLLMAIALADLHSSLIVAVHRKKASSAGSSSKDDKTGSR